MLRSVTVEAATENLCYAALGRPVSSRPHLIHVSEPQNGKSLPKCAPPRLPASSSPRLPAAAPPRRARGHLFWLPPGGAAPSLPGPRARSRSAGSAAPADWRDKLNPRECRPDRGANTTCCPFPWGVRLKLLDTHSRPRKRAVEAPFPRARTPFAGVPTPELGPLPLPFWAAPGSGSKPQRGAGSVRRAVRSPSKSRRCARSARSQRQLPGLGPRSQRGQSPARAARIPAGPRDELAAGAVRPSFSPFPPAAPLLPPPAGWVTPPALPDCSPTGFPAAQAAWRVQRSVEARLGAEVGSGRGTEGGGCERAARRTEARRRATSRGRGKSGAVGPAARPAPDEVLAVRLDALDRETFGCPASVRGLSSGTATSKRSRSPLGVALVPKCLSHHFQHHTVLRGGKP